MKDQGYLVPKKSHFNKILGDQRFELEFAGFLDGCDDSDVMAYAKNYLAVQFKLDYVKADGSISNYFPDFLVKVNPGMIVIVETKGLVDEDVPHKLNRLRQWCEDCTRIDDKMIYDFVYVDQKSYEKYKPRTFSQVLEGFREYKT